MGKHKGNPYGIRLIATSGTVLAEMLRELDEWYGRTPADRTDESGYLPWQREQIERANAAEATAQGWQKEAEARGLELDRLNAALTAAEQQRDEALNKQANLELKAAELTDENAALLLGVKAPDDARTINTRTVEYETRPPISTSGLQHIESCNSRLWQTPDTDGINPVCNQPKNHGGPHRSIYDGDKTDPMSWLITTNNNSAYGDNAIID